MKHKWSESVQGPLFNKHVTAGIESAGHIIDGMERQQDSGQNALLGKHVPCPEEGDAYYPTIRQIQGVSLTTNLVYLPSPWA